MRYIEVQQEKNSMKRTAKSVVLFWSRSGNTRKVAETIHRTIAGAGFPADLVEITQEIKIDYLEYYLIFCGAPVYSNLPPDPVVEFLKNQKENGPEILPGAPERPGHFAVVFCTYGGGHTGRREALPTLAYMGQFFEHAGIRVIDEWPVVGEFAGAGADYNTSGRLGDITGRPNDQDLNNIQEQVKGLLCRLRNL